jgi:hypothetical protein
MKKIVFIIASCFSIAAHAQNILPVYDQQQYGFEIKPANLYLEADKNLCELKELLNVNVRMLIADKENGVPYIFNYKFRDPFDAPWKIGEFKIVSGGATVVITDGSTAQLQMPATMPKEKAVVVQATLNPVAKGYQQVQIFTTIYLEDNDNVFYFNCPYLHINDEKYVVKNDGGAFTNPDAAVKKTIDKNIAPAKQKAGNYTLKAAGAEVAATQAGFDLSLLTSNAKAMYVPDEDITTILLNGDAVAMVNGVKSDSKRMYSIVLSFPGKVTGTFKIKSNKKITAAITFPQISTGYACTCADDPDAQDRHQPPTCMGGNITITKYDGKIIEGTVNAQLESSDASVNPPVTFYGRLNGKFKVRVAN